MSKTKQVGGTHYDAPPGAGHWDMMERYDIAYLEANATKYIARWRTRGTPLLDLGKAISYLDRIKEEGRGARRVMPKHAFLEWVNQLEIDNDDRLMLYMILVDGERDTLKAARAHLREMRDKRNSQQG